MRYTKVTAAEAYARAGEDRPRCEHGDLMLWNVDTYCPAGGYWRCAGYVRAANRAWYAANVATHRAASRAWRREPVRLDDVRLRDDAGYSAAHRWARKLLAGRPCDHADGTCSSKIEAALRADTPTRLLHGATNTHDRGKHFTRNLRWYAPLCQRHHRLQEPEVQRSLARRLARLRGIEARAA